MRASKLVRVCQGVENTVVERVDLAGDGGQEVLTVRVRPVARWRSRCSRCARRCPGYDRGDGLRMWRGLDVGVVKVFLVAAAPRVRCPTHGVVVAGVPWARPASRFTRWFEDQTAWLAAHTDSSTVAGLARITWRSVVGIVGRVTAELAGRTDRLAGLRRIGIDEVAYRKGQRYILRVVDHDTGRQVWAGVGANADTLRSFFHALGPARAAALTHVSADGAAWVHDVVRERAPQARICLDPFHIVSWATKALDQLRRRLQGQLRHAGRPEQAASLKGSRWALLKNPRELSPDQKATLAGIQHDNRQLYRGYLLKEQLRYVFRAETTSFAKSLLGGWLAWARRCRIPELTHLAGTIERLRPLIWNTIDAGGLSNAVLEATNNHLRLLTRRAYGFHSAQALIAMSELTLGGLCPPLPGRA
ncbi:MAG TPA: ISL3 family transposase [Kribbellaceae bacterium]|nr:ISL3 family transposase [Kribbellaceae bacterium]